MKRFLNRLLHKDEGSSMVELALVTPILVLLLLAAIDFARAYYLSTELVGAAHAGAEYGITSHSDTAGMKAAAIADAPDVPNLNVTTPTWGCECSDGSGSSASCSKKPACTYNMVYWVKVQASATYSTIYPWRGIPSTITITQTATVRSGS
ncbi:pilus assembly protein [Acidobacteria bacterium AB60]|nr:pilus assembly protein [Acidobacteria bacterium AB60]